MQTIIRKLSKEEEPKPKMHRVILDLSPEDAGCLAAMVAYAESNQAHVLRQCIRYVYAAQFAQKE